MADESAEVGEVGEWNGRDVAALLTLVPLPGDSFRNRWNQPNLNGALFGGQVLAQSLAAASATVDGARHAHSLHGYFLRAGRAGLPVLFKVDRTRDGGRFSTRRVFAMQEGVPIFHMECGFHSDEDGFEHQTPIPPDLPRPDQLQTLQQCASTMGAELPGWLRRRWLNAEWPVEVKPVDPLRLVPGHGAAARQAIWMRIPSATLDSVGEACHLAWMSDYWLAGTASLPHADPGQKLFMASLDHAMWFHRPVRVADWLLFDMESPSASGGRGFTLARIFAEDGRLVASAAQESLLRRRIEPPSGA